MAVSRGRPKGSGLAKVWADVRTLALPLLVSGGGLIGLVAFVGGALTWTRFSSAHLPAEQAISAMPEGALVTSGAVALTLFTVVGLLGVLITYLISRRVDERQRREPDEKERGMAYGLLALLVLESFVLLGYGYEALGDADDRTERVLAGLALLLLAVAFAVWVIERRLLPRAEVDHDPGRSPNWWHRRSHRLRGYISSAVVAVILAVAEWQLTGQLWVGLVLLIAGTLAFLCLRIFRVTDGEFAWYGVAVFFSVPIFGGALSIARAYDEPQLQPIALIREGDGPDEGLQGIFITENDDRVYLATIARAACDDKDLIADSGRMFWVSRDEVVTYAIGPPQNAKRAARTGPAMLRDLVKTRIHEDGAEAPVTEPDIAPAVRERFDIDKIEPRTAMPGQKVRITGEGFGPFKGTVNIGGVPAEDVRWYPDTGPDDRDVITFRVPEGAKTANVVVTCHKRQRAKLLTIERPAATGRKPLTRRSFTGLGWGD